MLKSGTNWRCEAVVITLLKERGILARCCAARKRHSRVCPAHDRRNRLGRENVFPPWDDPIKMAEIRRKVADQADSRNLFPVPWVRDMKAHVSRCARYCAELSPAGANKWISAQLKSSTQGLKNLGYPNDEVNKWGEAYVRSIVTEAMALRTERLKAWP